MENVNQAVIAEQKIITEHSIDYSNKKHLENLRRMIWIDVAIAVAGSDNCVSTDSPGKFADRILEDFDKKIF